MNRSLSALVTRIALSGSSFVPLWGQADPVDLPGVLVLSSRVANQEPSGPMAMPISGLRFEPQVDVQARSLAEGQADVSIRGGTFANTGFRVGSLSLYDPQTGHYSAEIPIAPELLTPPQVVTGAAQTRAGGNASVGSIGYGWRAIDTGGHMAAMIGHYGTYRAEARVAVSNLDGFGADVALAHSRSDGTIRYGDHEFTRANVRLQHRTETAQTDVFAGYQSKFFGWPNLYTPFNSAETENLQAVLLVANHRRGWGADGGFVEAGVYHRRHKDDYAFNRFAPVGPVHPFQHTTWVTGAAANGRWVASEAWAVEFRANALGDEIESTSLLYGRFTTRSYWSAGVFPEWRTPLASGGSLVVTAGAAYDDTNRDDPAVTPLLEIAREDPSAPWHRLFVSYSQASQVADYTALNANPSAGLFRGNAGLDRATTHNLEIGGNFTWAEWQGSAAIFARRDDDLVDWTFRQGVTARLARPVDIDTFGFEAYATRSFGVLDLLLGYTWLEKDADYGGATVDGSFYALNFPKHRLTAALIARLGSRWEVRFDNEARLQEDNPLRRVGGDEAIISAIGVYWRVPQVRGLQLSAHIDNLWNSNFEEVPAVPASRRLMTFGARWMW
jgi:vitamin B12 transporter